MHISVDAQTQRFLLGLLLALLMAATFLVSPLLAQKLDGTLRGDVKDQTGAMVPEAKVTATSDATNVSQTTLSTSSGSYLFPNLLPGTYTLTVEAKDFRRYHNRGVTVGSNQVAEVLVTLTLGAATEVIEVTAGGEVIQTQTSQLANNFNTLSVAGLPNTSLQASPLNLAILAPGTTTQGGGVLGEGGSIGGARPRMNSFSIDGVDDNRIDVTGHTSEVIQDAVAEFSLITNQFSAEYGHSAGGQFNITTKSGTNKLHGSAWLFNNNRDFNAMDNLEKLDRTSPRRVDYNRAGGTLGGPIVKDKIFVFGAYQRQWQGLATSATRSTAPTAAGLAALKSLVADNAPVLDILDQFPTARLSDAQCSIGSINETPIESGCFQASAPNFLNQHDFNTNGDINLGKHQVRLRFLYSRIRQPNVNPIMPQAQFTGAIASDNRKAIVTDAWAISNHLVNDFRLGYSRFVQGFTVPSNFSNFPNAVIDDLSLNIGPEGNSPQSYVQNNYQIADSISYNRGKHTFKFGVEGRRYIPPSDFLPRARGEWDYATLSELINDIVPTGSNGALRGAGTGFFNGNQSAFYWFAQDDLRLTPRLTLNLGLRYEWVGNAADASKQLLNSVATLPGVFEFRNPKTDKNNYAPRFGFAWDPLGNARWAVRGGIGVSYDLTAQNFTLLQLPPQLQTEQNPSITCSLADAPAWCPGFLAGGPGTGFLRYGGLLQVNVPPVTQADARAATGSIIVDTVQPKVITWTVGVQHEIFKNASVELRYLGTSSQHLVVQSRLNTISAFDAGLTPLPTYFSSSDIPASVPLTGIPTRADFNTFANNGNNCLAGGYLIHAADGFCGLVTAFPAVGQGIYHGGSVDFNRRYSRGLTLRANYTFAKNIDNSTNELFSSLVNPRRSQDWRHLDQDRGRSVLDIRHKLAISWTYELPKSKSENRFLTYVLNGWQYNGTYLAQSGQPVTIQSVTDSNVNGDSAGDRAVFNPNGTSNTGSGVDWVLRDPITGATSICTSDCDAEGMPDTVGYVATNSGARYIQAERGALATVGRNTFTSPGVGIFNMSMFKNTKLTERVNLQFRVEALNTFNHRNFTLTQPSVFQNGGGTVNNALSSSYANVTADDFLSAKQFSGGSRTMLLAIKVEF
jgi:hypothetical protein